MKRPLAVFVVATVLAGCSHNSLTNDLSIVEAIENDQSSIGTRAYSIPAQAGPDSLTLLAIQHNPRLKALRHRAERLEQKVPQAQSLPRGVFLAISI